MCFDSRGVVALPDDRGLVAALVQMAVDAVGGDVEHAVLEPFDRDVAGREGGVLDLGEGLDPVDALGLLGPESVGVADRARIHVAVFGLVDKGALGPFGRIRRKSSRTSIPSTHRGQRTRRPPAVFIVDIDYASPGRAGDKAETSPTLVGGGFGRRRIRLGPVADRPERSLSRFAGSLKSTLSREWRAMIGIWKPSCDESGLAMPAITP